MVKRKSKSDVKKNRTRGERGRLWARMLRWTLWMAFLFILGGALVGGGAFMFLRENLPRISTLADYQPPVVTRVFAEDGSKIAEFYKERRIVIPLERMPRMLIEAFIAAEDSRFYQHEGLDLKGIVRAFFKNLEAGAIVQGGSTITQQVTKSFFLTPERSYTRKIKEAILAYRIDKTFTKEEILYLYLNQIYLGHGAYGVEAAAENYFDKSAAELNLAQCAMLAGLPQAPSRYSPFRYPDRARERQIYVLRRMHEEGYITEFQAQAAINQKLVIKPRRNWYVESTPYYTEHVRQYVEQKYGTKALYEGGLDIHTAVSVNMQEIARQELVKGLGNLDKRQGYRGPLRRLAAEEIETFAQGSQARLAENPLAPGRVLDAVVVGVDRRENVAHVRLGQERGILSLENMRWARKPDPDAAFYEGRVNNVADVLRTGDVILVKVGDRIEESGQWRLFLEQEPKVQGALLCMETGTGYVRAMIGGRDFKQSQFNRATQSRRQPGSAFKPIVYAAALDKGYTPATMLIDSPIVFQDRETDFTWKPKNYSERFYGPTLLRNALAKSRNVITVKILRDIGVDYVIRYARRLGVESHINRDLSIALGSSGISLLELVNAYAVFANLGNKVEPIFVKKVVDRHGNVLEENRPVRQQVVESSTAYLMTSMLQSVVEFGTGRRVKALGRPVAGKTGTTNNLFDAWFMGYTPDYVAGTWVGFDEEGSLGKGETGSRAASPIWLGFMQRILADKPVRVFQVPEGVVFARIDAETGLLPVPESGETLFECFKEGTVPTEYAKRPGSITEAEELFKSGM